MSRETDRAGPGARAGSEPEPGLRGDRAVHAVGVGPGARSYLTGRAREVLGAADVVVGFETVVDVVRGATDATLLSCGYDDQEATLERFGDRVASEAGAAVLMGDPNVSGYQFLGRLEAAVTGPVRVVPGVSSVQVAASRARTPLERSTIVSLHRRGSVDTALADLVAAAGQRHLLVLPRPFDWMPADIAAHLIDRDVDPALTALVFERLTLDDEDVSRSTLRELAADAGGEGRADSEFSDLSVLVVRATGDGVD
ncbi:MAG: cobalt-precorrin-7 (C(5))-methyltransferase [Salinirussus sp.]